MIKKYLVNRINKAFDDNQLYITTLIRDYIGDKKGLKVLDVGCSSGTMTKKILGDLMDTNEIHGVDYGSPTKEKGIKYASVNLEKDNFPYKDKHFDIVFSNQVVEHILNKDLMLAESYRVLKDGGLFIISTENIASLDNIISLLLGQEPLCQHTSNNFHTQSFLSPSFMQKMEDPHGNTYGHKNVCSYYGLQRLLKLAGFKNLNVRSFGNFFNFVEKLLPMYNRILIISCIK